MNIIGRMTDDQCRELITLDSLWLIHAVGICKVSARMYVVIGSNQKAQPFGNYYANSDRPIENYAEWEAITKPMRHWDAMQVLAYMQEGLRKKAGLPPTTRR